MTNEFELADDTREKLIYEKSDLLAPLLPWHGRSRPYERRLGDDEEEYFLGLPSTGFSRTTAPAISATLCAAPDESGLPVPAPARGEGSVSVLFRHPCVDSAGHRRHRGILDARAGDDLGGRWE